MKQQDFINLIKDGEDIFERKYFYINYDKKEITAGYIDWICLNSFDEYGESTICMTKSRSPNDFDTQVELRMCEVFLTKREAKEYLKYF